MTEGQIWLIAVCAAVLIAAIGIPLLGRRLRERDFQRQVEGKRPERRADEAFRAPDEGKDPSLSEAERERDFALLKSKQNLFGPR